MKKIFLLIALFSFSMSLQAEEKKSPPNVIIVVSDDGGWADFGFNGCPDFKTPNLDTLAAQGTVFKNGYVSASVCSPSRAGLLSGRYQTRFGHELNPPMDTQEKTGLPLSEKTLANRFQSLGYTTGAFGKWHLGSGDTFKPAKRGFDYSYVFLRGSRGYKPEEKESDNDRTMRLNDKPQRLTEYLTDSIAKNTAQYIEAEKNNPKPLFLYVAFNCPHSPLQAKPGYEDKFPELKGARRTIAAMQTSLDEGIGTIVEALKKTNRWDNTLFWFVNDNGAATYGNFNNGVLRNNKGSLFDGGTKVAFMAHFPKGMKTRKTFNNPMISLDIASTSLKLAGGKAKDTEGLEGLDLTPYLLDDKKSTTSRPLFWRQNNVGAVQKDMMKLIVLNGEPTMLFNLEKDPSEKTNLIETEKDKVPTLLAEYKAWDEKNITPLWRANPKAHNEQQYGKNASWERKKGKKNPSKKEEE